MVDSLKLCLYAVKIGLLLFDNYNQNVLDNIIFESSKAQKVHQKDKLCLVFVCIYEYKYWL